METESLDAAIGRAVINILHVDLPCWLISSTLSVILVIITTTIIIIVVVVVL